MQELCVKWNKSLHLRRLRTLHAAALTDRNASRRQAPSDTVAVLSDSSDNAHSVYQTPPGTLTFPAHTPQTGGDCARILPGPSVLLSHLEQRTHQVRPLPARPLTVPVLW